jgi:hypothetical protein
MLPTHVAVPLAGRAEAFHRTGDRPLLAYTPVKCITHCAFAVGYVFNDGRMPTAVE